ncbi:hypothetical protein SAMN02745166_02086 [Prosthecobacter debontii]|uniref:Uncharacterized protein n=1 Tax=Prosthecobacter debontii TaxID=48467 RepID=A0A1T4XUY7_9BACT|nr:hypothetical protein SAMN02745166_02086 [Prosthecobacter debontii]
MNQIHGQDRARSSPQLFRCAKGEVGGVRGLFLSSHFMRASDISAAWRAAGFSPGRKACEPGGQG